MSQKVAPIPYNIFMKTLDLVLSRNKENKSLLRVTLH